MNKQIKNMNRSDLFSTEDLYLPAAILTTRQADLVTSEVVVPGKVMRFYLTNPEICQQLQSDFINGKLLVDSKAFSENVKQLLSLRREY